MSSENLWQDGLHLNNSGKNVILNNYVLTLNDSYFFRSILYSVDSNSLFEVKLCKPTGNVGLNRKSDNILNNQVQVTKTVSVDSVITNAKIGMRKMKIQFPEKLIVAHLNINSIKNKFDFLSFMIEHNADILLISETKLDDSFPSGQFNICEFSMPYRLIDMIEIQWVVDFYFILEMTFQPNF